MRSWMAFLDLSRNWVGQISRSKLNKRLVYSCSTRWRKTLQTLEALSSNVNAKLRPFLIAANPANLDMWIKIASSLEEGFRHEETSSPVNGPRYRQDFQNIDSRNATPSQDSLPSGARPGREVGDRQETRRKQFYQDFRAEDNEENTEPPFPFQEEEDLERCLGVEPNKQASTDSPQVLFSSIKNPDHPTEPLEKLLLVSVDTQTESESVDCRNLRLFVTDKNTGLRFLVDSGADISIIPPKDKNRMPSSDYKLYAANGTEIVTYGTKEVVWNVDGRVSKVDARCQQRIYDE
ncbi:hypothetical protein LAZ67_3000909 [Cordylochernes scorpioides]|uniref:Peptidase A2 domain-containing protein n=1 Tax=Cordylochernes scorpioides TaxID=51811 RepID=A0ABY6K7A1_9ARAC|nr:hypothetical protein LAZ67_3000909 [Cordylochernes scorpioides]